MLQKENPRIGMYRVGNDAFPALALDFSTPIVCSIPKAAAALAGMTGRADFREIAHAVDIVSLLDRCPDIDILLDLAGRLDSLPDDAVIQTPAKEDFACPIHPRQVFCVGMNIAQLFVPEKITGKMPLIREAPYAAPMWWMKAASSVIGSDEAIVHPGEWHTNRLIPEPELGLVVGRPLGPGIATPKAKDALEYLAGYCIFNDVSALDIEFERGGEPFAFNMAWSKSYPTFAPLGPLVTLRSGIDPANLGVTMDVSGVRKVDENTSSYLWSPQELVEHFAAVTNLMPGDVIACGNLTGEHRIVPGDVVDIAVERLGVLSNPIVRTPREATYAVPQRVTDYARNFRQTISAHESLGAGSE